MKLLMEHFHLILNFYYETFFSNFHSILFKLQLKNETKKRKITEEGRLFNKKWTYDYFFLQANTKAICLIFRELIPVFKDYNMKRHYTQKHTAMFGQYQGMCCKNKIVELKRSMSCEKSFLNETTSIVTASYVVANLIARKSKSYSDGKFIKQCI